MKKLLYIITCNILFFSAIFFAYDSYYVLANNKIAVLSPDFINKNYNDVLKTAKLMNLNIEVITKEHSDFPKDYVYLQIPEPNKPIKSSRTVRIALSLGPYEMKLRNFPGLSLQEAKTEIHNMGLTLKTISYVYDEMPFNTVIGTYPLDNEVLYKKRKISLLVSAGQKNKLVKMPYLIGLDYGAAVNLLNENELINIDARYIDNKKVPKNTVIYQNYTPEKEIMSGTFVDLIISK